MKNDTKKYNSMQFYNAYKRIRNQFRKYSSTNLITHCILYLYAPVENEIMQLKKNPWLILLLIKWIIIDDKFNDNYSKKNITPNQFYDILQMMLDLSLNVRMPDKYS